MTRGALSLALVCSFALGKTVFASPESAAQLLEASMQALQERDYRRSRSLARAVIATSHVNAERAEGFRIVGVSSFFLGDKAAAERGFFQYLKLDPEGHLQPQLLPPEVIVFFEDVRAKRAGELEAVRPKAINPGTGWLNLLPPLGQFQNGDRTKGWLIAGAGLTLIAANVASYALLHSWCDDTSTCDGRSGDARLMRSVNVVSAVSLAGLYLYSVADGVFGRRAIKRRLTVTVVPTDGAAVAGIRVVF